MPMNSVWKQLVMRCTVARFLAEEAETADDSLLEDLLEVILVCQSSPAISLRTLADVIPASSEDWKIFKEIAPTSDSPMPA